MAADPPSHAQVVIIGGGVIGCSVAYHLAEIGWREVVPLEHKQLTCGAPTHRRSGRSASLLEGLYQASGTLPTCPL